MKYNIRTIYLTAGNDTGAIARARDTMGAGWTESGSYAMPATSPDFSGRCLYGVRLFLRRRITRENKPVYNKHIKRYNKKEIRK